MKSSSAAGGARSTRTPAARKSSSKAARAGVSNVSNEPADASADKLRLTDHARSLRLAPCRLPNSQRPPFASVAGNELRFVGAMPSHEGFEYLTEKSRRQEAIVKTVFASDFPEIVTGPIEFIALGDDDPRTLVVQPEMPFHRRRDFDGTARVGSRRMRDRLNGDECGIVGLAFNRKHDHARAIFTPFFLARLALVVPQICIGNDKARFGRRDRHAPPSLGIKHGVQMRMPPVHARRANCLNFFVGQFRCCEAAAVLLEASKFFVLVRRHEVACDRAVARYCHCLALGQHPVAAKIPGKLRSRDGVSHSHIPSRLTLIYAIYAKSASCAFSGVQT